MSIWITDNPVSKKWPLYTRGNVGEVFPEVVLSLTWDLFGQEAENGWRQAFENFGLVADGDLPADEDMIILSVFGGYCYINASYVRLLGVRAPGGSVEVIDKQFFGESDAPDYEPRDGDKNLKSSAKLGKKVLSLLRTKSLPQLEDDKAMVRSFLAKRPADSAPEQEQFDYIVSFKPIFQALFCRHIENTFSVALVSGALSDLCVKVGKEHLLVSLLGGIGDVESAAPSAAMWKLSRSAMEISEVSSEFDQGVAGLLQRLEQVPAADGWLSEFAAFIADFGSRGPNEWDLGSDPWEFRPELALAAINRMRSADPSHNPEQQTARLVSEREAAIAEVRGALNVVDRFVFDKALRSTTLFSQARERSKTTIIRAIHGARLSQRALSRSLANRGGPSERFDVCLLQLNEVQKIISGKPSQFDSLISKRKVLHGELTNRIPPFIVEGVVPAYETWEVKGANIDLVTAGQKIQGIPGCPGVARGRACVVTDPGDPRDLGPGDVLVAPITDPSWTPLFLSADAVVVDVGAVMSHAIIVSRELGIPCVVSATDATRVIPDGALIEVDGSTGLVTIIELP